ncbi:ABC transporter ATP-binding protein [Micromonospora aurantiaca (nom. illeg.)]|uniref:ABC transporter ATP-binding protein n=1 Tax=Micromonospora aurantiaca (nom. illeg.) TaxID=47850 RepID=UPI00197B7DEF|nr:ABC transporter ATP-binding protein [Micromonospora aurantiaca]
MKVVIDQLAGGPVSASSVLAPAAGLAIAGVSTTLLPYIDKLLRGDVARGVSLLARDRLYRAVNSFIGLHRFENPHFLDQLRLAEGCVRDTPSQIISSSIQLAKSLVTVVGFLVSLYLVDQWLTLVVVLGALPVLVAEVRLAGSQVGAVVRISPLERRQALYSTLLSSVDAAKEIRLFGVGDYLQDKMKRDGLKINFINQRLDRRTIRLQGIPAFVSASIAAGGLVWAVSASRDGKLSVGDIAIFIAGVSAVQGGLTTFAIAVAATYRELRLFDAYLAVVNAGPDLPAATPACPASPLASGIEFRDVWFRYSEQHEWVLRGVNVVIPKGKSVGLVGLNGAGKSTLVKLLCRFYDPTRGSVLWDGVDIRRIPAAELRRRISGVFQDFVSYDLTAAENIAIGDLSIAGDARQIEAAAEKAGIHAKLVSLPAGYNTMLTRAIAGSFEDPKDGVELSGGQWQRVAVARGLARSAPDLLIMDEPSSGLDASAEYQIHRVLRTHRADQTFLLISHRLSAIRDADTIVVLSNGVVIEEGSHLDLISRNGCYARLFRLQADGYLPDEQRIDPASHVEAR